MAAPFGLRLAPSQLEWLLDVDGWGIGIQSTAAYNDGAWHHVVATWAAPANTPVEEGQFALFVDGAGPVDTTGFTINCGGVGVSPLSGAQGARIATSSSWSIFFDGNPRRDRRVEWCTSPVRRNAALQRRGGDQLALIPSRPVDLRSRAALANARRQRDDPAGRAA